MTTQLAEKLAPLASSTRLYTKALDILRAGHGGEVTDGAVESLARFLAETEPMSTAMIGESGMAWCCREYLERVDEDRRGVVRSAPLLPIGHWFASEERVLVGLFRGAHEGLPRPANQREAASAASASASPATQRVPNWPVT